MEQYIIYGIIGAVILFIIIGLAICNFAGENLLNVYKRFSRETVDFYNSINFSNNVSNAEFNGRIRVEVQEGFLNDHYCNGTITLSSEVANNSNVASFAVCAHELGHAMQYRDKPNKMHSFARRLIICNLFAKLTMPLFIIGLAMFLWQFIPAVIVLAVAFVSFFIGLIAKLSTIKIESEASENALVLLRTYAEFDETQIKQAKKVLKSAKLTYIASFLRSVLKWTMLVRKYDFY